MKDSYDSCTAVDCHSEDDLFTTYQKFLRDCPEELEGAGDSIPVEGEMENTGYPTRGQYLYNGQGGLPPKKRRKNARISEAPRTIEKRVQLWLRVEIAPDEVDRFNDYLKRGVKMSELIESGPQNALLVKKVPAFSNFHKIRQGDQLLSINEEVLFDTASFMVFQGLNECIALFV